jgi:hypothetical protein
MNLQVSEAFLKAAEVEADTCISAGLRCPACGGGKPGCGLCDTPGRRPYYEARRKKMEAKNVRLPHEQPTQEGRQ